MRRSALLVLVGALLVAPAWVLGTESGLRFAVAVAQRATHGALRIGEAHGRLAGEVTLRDFVYANDAATVAIARAVVSLKLAPLLTGGIEARSLDVQSLSVTTRTRAPGRTEPLTVRMPLALAIDDGHVAGFSLTLAARPPWTLPEVRLRASWSGRWIMVESLDAQTVEAGSVGVRGRLAIVDDRLQVEDLEVTGAGKVVARGALALDDAAASDLSVSWTDLHSPRPDLLPWLTAPAGRSRLAGPWRDYAWTARGRVRAAGLEGDVDARGRGSLQGLTFEQVDVATLGGRAHASGRIAWSPALATELALRFENLDPGVQYKEWPGRLSGEVRLAARWQGRATTMDFDGALRDSQLRGYPLALKATGRTEDRSVFLKALELRSGGSTARASGALLPTMDLAGELRSDDLRSLWSGLGGRGALRVRARGTFAAPAVELRGGVDDVAFGGARARHVALDGTLAFAGRSDLQLRLDDLRGAVALKTLALSLAGTRGAHRLRAEADAESGSAALVALEGGLAAGGWRGQVREARLAPAQGPAWTLEEPAALDFARGRFVTEPVCLGNGDSRACARVEATRGAFVLAFRTRDFDLAHLTPWLPPDWSVAGTLSGTAYARIAGGELAELRADLAGSAGSIQSGDAKLAYGPGTLRVLPDGPKLHAEAHLTPAGGAIDGEVWVAPAAGLLDRPMLGDLTLRLPDLSWLPVLSPEIASAQGSVEAQLHVSGSPRSPVLDGKLHVAGGRVALATPGIELTDISASFERGRDAPLALHVEGTSGGRLVVDGRIQEVQPKVAGEITIRGQDVLGVNNPEVRAWLSPNLTLALGEGRARLTGELAVPRADITPRQLGGGGVAPSADQVVVRGEEEAPRAALRVESEVKIALGDAVQFDGLGLKAQLAGAITAIDDPERATRGRGELTLKGGRYKAYGQELKIDEGRLIFTGGPVTDPAIDITASRQPREDIKVMLHARGTLEKPEFTLTSDPPELTQEEKLSWLVLGRSLSSTMDAGQRSQMSGAALSLGLTGGDVLAQQLAPRMGLDQVSLAAKPGETADLARLTIGKYLSPRLFVSYGVGLFTPGQYFRLQYDVGKHVKLIGESGAAQGGQVTYTIER